MHLSQPPKASFYRRRPSLAEWAPSRSPPPPHPPGRMEDSQNMPSIPTIGFVSTLPFSTHGTHELLRAITHAAHRSMLFSLHGTAHLSARLHNRPAGELLYHDSAYIIEVLVQCYVEVFLVSDCISALFRVLHKLYDAGVHGMSIIEVSTFNVSTFNSPWLDLTVNARPPSAPLAMQNRVREPASENVHNPQGRLPDIMGCGLAKCCSCRGFGLSPTAQ